MPDGTPIEDTYIEHVWNEIFEFVDTPNQEIVQAVLSQEVIDGIAQKLQGQFLSRAEFQKFVDKYEGDKNA